jgi:hypothetical protein
MNNPREELATPRFHPIFAIFFHVSLFDPEDIGRMSVRYFSGLYQTAQPYIPEDNYY